MKQIIIITRIDSDKSNDEFVEIFGETARSPISGIDKEQNLYLSIYNGIDFYDKNKQIAEKIKSLITPEMTEVLIVVHYTGNFEGLYKALNSINDGRGWQIQKYSSRNKNYDQIKRVFQDVYDDSSKVEPVYKLFSSDHVLEAKIELLHNCIVPEGIPSEENLDDLPPELLNSFKKFKKRVEEIAENKLGEAIWNNKDYEDALTELRESFLSSQTAKLPVSLR